ncbi:response regulator transcription factor [Terrabacter sp. BE26]|uniref:helix-turn-helix transcriptional regulator n=1 Tax=Terrabacter sp. BE26 TaxID=2898152 RepID=UPI0035BE268F
MLPAPLPSEWAWHRPPELRVRFWLRVAEGNPVLNDVPIAETIDIAASTVPLLERARGLVESLDRWLPVEAIWLTLSDPESHVYATVGSTGLERSVLDYLDRPTVAREIQLAELNQDRPPVAVTELPVPIEDRPTWAECLIPAGFRDGLAVPLVEPGGPYLGMLGLLCSSTEPPSGVQRDSVGRLAPLIARAVSPLRSLIATARLVRGATAGAVLLRDGSTYPLPGLEHHPSLVDSLVLDMARRTLLAGEVYRSFMWPSQDGPGFADHARITVLAATDVPAFVLGTVLLAPEAGGHGLTPREMQVLGLIVDGHSNQQIASRLSVAPRTVAAHVEHILHKLEVPTRTLAAVQAEREGCYVPPGPRVRR